MSALKSVSALVAVSDPSSSPARNLRELLVGPPDATSDTDILELAFSEAVSLPLVVCWAHGSRRTIVDRVSSTMGSRTS